MLDAVRAAVAQGCSLQLRMVAIGRDAAQLVADDALSATERAAYRTAVEAVLGRLRATCRTADDLAIAFYVDHAELLAHAASACAGAGPNARVSPVVARDAAVFERAREVAGLDR